MATDSLVSNLGDVYGANCFSNAVMRERLPKGVFTQLLRVQAGEKELTADVAEVVASAMRDWAIERGATHYTHWFHPLSGISAEKHDSFISPTGDGRVLIEFSGKELVKGESDASSFPSGGLRATFEARGYTAWDVTSPAFLKQAACGTTLCIPTAFVSYYGHALDKKVPLLRSIDAVNKHALRVLNALGIEGTKRVLVTVGAEQEYFLVNAELAKKRPDLLLTGRSVFGSMPAKGQEMEDHYYGAIPEKVASFMHELNNELWQMGISAKTQHNEVAPNQFELACVFSSANVAADGNQAVMETINKVARRHGMMSLLHEKPFSGINGSGKHLNYSLCTDTGQNLFEPGFDSHSNIRFFLFLTAVIEAVDLYANLLRASVATSGNDWRLGGNEAPPPIISIFLGDELASILEKVAQGKTIVANGKGKVEIGATTLPKLPKDLTDRNRTSPFAFTGNKFEFRMVGSSQSVATPTTILNTALADVLQNFADRLEQSTEKDILVAGQAIIADSYKKHQRVVFNGNGYSEEWRKEAEKRGLPSFKTAVEVIPEFASPGAIELFSRQEVFSKIEIESRCLIYLERYSKQINIEAGMMLEMARCYIFPAATGSAEDFARAAAALDALGIPAKAQIERAKRLAELSAGIAEGSDQLEAALLAAQQIHDELAEAQMYRDSVMPCMNKLRSQVDALENLVERHRWPFPTYENLLFTL